MIEILVFSASYCGPCKSMEAAGIYKGLETDGYKVTKIDTEQQKDLADKFGIYAIPTFLILKDGTPVRRVIGARTKDSLLSELKLAEE